jgi:AcrR family transcriptional regulator
MPDPRSSDDTRDRLLRAAALAFAEHGYDGASTRDICAAAGANLAAIHYHFGDKQALYQSVLEEPLRQLDLATADLLEPGLSVDQGVARLVRGLLIPLRSGITGRALVRLVQAAWADDHHPLPDPAAVRRHFAATCALIARGTGHGRPEDPAVMTLALAIVGMCHLAVVGAPMAGPAVAPLFAGSGALDDLERRLTRHALDLIAAERHRLGAPS